MKKIAEFIVSKRILFVIIFFALIAFSVFSVSWVGVEEDITVYLPDSAEAKRGLELMNEEFVTYASASLMVEDASETEAQYLYDKLCAIEGVVMVDFDFTSGHYSDGKALYSITFDGDASQKSAKAGLANVKECVSNYEYSLYSESFSSIADILVKEMAVILVIVVIVVIAVLIFTSSNYIEPIVMLLTFVAAAIINMGTNFIFGTISFVSNSVAIVLQLALSVDYAIIYCNRYKQEHETKSIEQAAVDALAVSIPEIAASSLTTIAGLGAMAFMQFRLGLDMGICLIKAIILSLLSVFLLMPALIIAFGPAMDKTKHKNFVPKISFVGRFAYKTRYIIPAVFVLLVVVAYISFGHTKYAYYTDLIENAHKNEEDIAKANIEATFGKSNLVAVMFPSGDYDSERAMVQELKECEEVQSVLSLATYEAMDGLCLGDKITYSQFMELADVDEITAKALFAYYAADVGEAALAKEDLKNYTAPLIDLFLTVHDVAGTDTVELTQEQIDMIDGLYAQLQMARDQLQGTKYDRMLVYINLTEQSDATFAFLDHIHNIGERYYPEGVILTGNSVSTKDFADTFEGDINIVGFLSIGLVMLILLFTFKSVGMPILLIVVIQGSIWLNFSIAVWTKTYVFFMCYLIVSAIQMGANIDYAIVISSRYNELRDAGADQKSAIIDTVNLTFPTVITSGTMMVVAGLLIGRNVSQAVIAGMGHYVGTGTAITLILVNFVLPQILLLGDKFVRTTTLRTRRTYDLGKLLKAGAAALLAVAMIFAGVITPEVMGSISQTKTETMNRYEELALRMEALHGAAETMDAGMADAKYSFAESLVTDEVGAQEVADGEAQIEEGEKTLTDAKEQYADGQAQYLAGKKKYEAGLAEYQAAEALVAEGQAQYDEGERQLNAAKQTYAEGQAALALVQPLYDMVMPSYNDYLAKKAQYDAAVASGDTATASSLELQVAIAKGLYENTIGLTGYSISGLLAAYNDAQAQLTEGAAQIADAEAQLAAAKIQLDDGYAQLAEGKKELDEGKRLLDAAQSKLNEGKAQIDEGEKQLDDAKTQLQEGKDFLDENRDHLQESITDLEGYTEEEKALLEALNEAAGIEGAAKKMAAARSYTEKCETLQKYFTQERIEIREQAGAASNLSALLLLAVAFGVVALVMYLARQETVGLWCAFTSAAVAMVCGSIWKSRCTYFDGRVIPAAYALTVTALLFALILGAVLKARRSRVKAQHLAKAE